MALLLQVVLWAGDISSPVKQTPDQTPLNTGWVVGPGSQDSGLCGWAFGRQWRPGCHHPSSEAGCQGKGGSPPLPQPWTWWMGIHCWGGPGVPLPSLLCNAAGVVDGPLPEPGCHRSKPQGHLFKELHIEVGHSSDYVHRLAFQHEDECICQKDIANSITPCKIPHLSKSSLSRNASVISTSPKLSFWLPIRLYRGLH